MRKPRYEMRLSAFPFVASIGFFLGWLFLLFYAPEWASSTAKTNALLGISIITALWSIHLGVIEGQP